MYMVAFKRKEEIKPYIINCNSLELVESALKYIFEKGFEFSNVYKVGEKIIKREELEQMFPEIFF